MNKNKLRSQRRWRHGLKIKQHVAAIKKLVSNPVVDIPAKKQDEILDYIEDQIGELL